MGLGSGACGGSGHDLVSLVDNLLDLLAEIMP